MDSVVLERDHYKTIISSLPTVSRKSKTICASANSYNLRDIDPLLYQNITKILIQKNDGSYEKHEIQKDYQPTLSYEIKTAVEKLNKSTENGSKNGSPSGLGILKYLLFFLLIGVAYTSLITELGLKQKMQMAPPLMMVKQIKQSPYPLFRKANSTPSETIAWF